MNIVVGYKNEVCSQNFTNYSLGYYNLLEYQYLLIIILNKYYLFNYVGMHSPLLTFTNF